MTSDTEPTVVPDAFSAPITPIKVDPDQQWQSLYDFVADNIPGVDTTEWLQQFETIREEHARKFEQYMKTSADGVTIVGADEKPDDEQQEQTPHADST